MVSSACLVGLFKPGEGKTSDVERLLQPVQRTHGEPCVKNRFSCISRKRMSFDRTVGHVQEAGLRGGGWRFPRPARVRKSRVGLC